MHIRYGRIFNNHFIMRFIAEPGTEFWKSVNIWQSYEQE